MTCRICLENDGTTIRGVCDCTGSMAFVHKHCITRWIIESGKKKCEVCHANYRLSVPTIIKDDCFISILCALISVVSIVVMNLFVYFVPVTILIIPAVLFMFHMLSSLMIYHLTRQNPLIVFALLQLVCGTCFLTTCVVLLTTNKDAINGIYVQCGLFICIPIIGIIFRLITRV